MKRFWIRRAPFIFVLVIVGIVVFGQIVMLLWNALMPVVFHLPLITFWQALGLLVLSKILFGGFRGGGPRPYWRDKARQKWMNMTPEEREKFKSEWGRRCRRPYPSEESYSSASDTGGEGYPNMGEEK
jgi:Ca2+/H+ antiporter, TMEM165/GDT1 family